MLQPTLHTICNAPGAGQTLLVVTAEDLREFALDVGREVMHTEKAVFQVEIADPTTKKGSRVKSFFLYSQTQPAPMQ